MYNSIYLIKNTPDIKKGRLRTKQALLKKMWNQKGGECLLVLIGLKVLVMMNSLQNIVISGAQGLLMLMGSKFLIKMTRPQNIKIKTVFCGLVILIKNFDPINIRRPWAPEITMFCSELIMIKTFKPIKTRRHWPPIWFHNFFSKTCLVLGRPFLHLGCFWLDFPSFFNPSG